MRMNTYSKIIPPSFQSPVTNQDSPTKSDNIPQFKPPGKAAELPPSGDFPLSREKVLLARDL